MVRKKLQRAHLQDGVEFVHVEQSMVTPVVSMYTGVGTLFGESTNLGKTLGRVRVELSACCLIHQDRYFVIPFTFEFL